MSEQDNGKSGNDGNNGGALVGVALVGSTVWDGCTIAGLTVGGPVGGAIGWLVGAGLSALGIGVAANSGSSK